MKNKEIEESINRIKNIVDFYKLNDENNYDYSDDVLISMKNLLSYIEQLEQCYCNRTDCSSRIKDSKKYDSLLQKYEQLENNRDKAIEYLNKTVFNEKGYINFCYELENILKGDSE